MEAAFAAARPTPVLRPEDVPAEPVVPEPSSPRRARPAPELPEVVPSSRWERLLAEAEAAQAEAGITPAAIPARPTAPRGPRALPSAERLAFGGRLDGHVRVVGSEGGRRLRTEDTALAVAQWSDAGAAGALAADAEAAASAARP